MRKIGILALLIKLGPKLLGALKALKFGKVGLAGASLASYAFLFNWEFAFVIIFALGVHESGHVWAMKKIGIKTKGFYFIPFMGGAAIPEEQFPSRSVEVFVALMGPIWGFGTAIIPAVIYFVTNNPWFAAVSAWISMVNLFNLLPINPLDGGRVVKALAFSVHNRVGLLFLLLGTIISIIGFLFIGLYIFVFIAIIGVIEMLGEYASYKASMSQMVLADAHTRRIIRRKYAGLSKNGVVGAMSAYAILISLLFGLNYILQHAPGADIAMQVLTDSS